jgi:hypothetical protein
MAINRANSTDTQGTTQTQTGNVAAVSGQGNVYVTTFNLAGGTTITVAKNTAAGSQVGNVVERDSDGGFWDTGAGIPVPPEYTSLFYNDMRPNS